MSGTIKLALAVIIGLVVFGAVALVGINAQRSETDGSTSTSTQANLNAVQDEDVALTITYTGLGFEPNNNAIDAHSTVRIRNRSVRVLEFMSNPYTTHLDNPELNIGRLNPGESKTFYVSQKGRWGYHNALDPSEVGTLLIR